MHKAIRIALSISFTIVCLFSFNTKANAKEFKASFAKLPVSSESPDKGVLVDLVKLWAKKTGNKVDISVLPFKRSLVMAIDHQVDFHIPLIKNPHQSADKLDFDYSTSPIFSVNFVLYTNKSKPVDIKKIAEYNIVTDAAHVDLFDFKITGDYSVEASLKKLNIGRIDGYIFADVEADPVLKKLGYKNIKRELFKIYDVHAVLPKGEKGKDADVMISEGMERTKESGEYSKLMDPVYKAYDDWQP